MYHIALSVTWRFEELNTLLEIIKLNFKKDYCVHVFCNLCHEDFEGIKGIVQDRLIDDFIHYPDKLSTKTNTAKQDCKRRQPLILLTQILNYMQKFDSFIYSECDVFPLSEDHYIHELCKIKDTEISVRYANIKNPKVPAGYICPAPMYLTGLGAHHLSVALEKYKKKYLAEGFALEGMLAHSAANCGVVTKVYSNFFESNQCADKNLEPITKTTHQHNIFNLRAELLKRNITKGSTIKQILEEHTLSRAWNNAAISFDSDFMLHEMLNQYNG